MRFVVDARLPPALAGLLASHGHQADHVADIGMRDAADSQIWAYAIDNGAVIVTKDEDFPHRLRQSPQKSPVVLWLRVGNTSRRALVEWFEPLLPQIEASSNRAIGWSRFADCAARPAAARGAGRHLRPARPALRPADFPSVVRA